MADLDFTDFRPYDCNDAIVALKEIRALSIVERDAVYGESENAKKKEPELAMWLSMALNDLINMKLAPVEEEVNAPIRKKVV